MHEGVIYKFLRSSVASNDGVLILNRNSHYTAVLQLAELAELADAGASMPRSPTSDAYEQQTQLEIFVMRTTNGTRGRETKTP